MALSRSGARRAVAEGSAKDIAPPYSFAFSPFPASSWSFFFVVRENENISIWLSIATSNFKITVSKGRGGRKFRASFEEKCRGIRIDVTTVTEGRISKA